MKLSRQVGTVSQILNIFVQDAAVTTGAGLANVLGSTVSFSWFRNNQAGVSTGVASTAGAMGIYSTSAWVQISSSNALGWYQFGVPNGALLSGDAAAIHFYGAAGMAALPVEIELTKTNNQQYASSTVFLAYTSTSPADLLEIYSQAVVTSGAGILNTSTQTLAAAGSDIQTVHGSPIVTTAAGIMSVDMRSIHGTAAVTSAGGTLQVSTQVLPTTTNANVLQIYGSAAVTSASGQFRVSTQALPTTTNANLLEIYGSAVVTSASGQLRVSTQAIDKGGYGVTSFAASITTNANLMQIYGSAAVTSGSGILNTSTQTLAAAGSDIQTVHGSPIVTTAAGIMSIDMRSIHGTAAVTSAGGTLQVSTQALLSTTFANVVQIIGQIAQTTAAGVLRVSTQALTVPDNTGIANISSVVNNALAESYRANGATGTIAQLMYEIVAHVGETSITGTTKTINTVGHTSAAMTFQLNSTTPTAITRIT